MDAPFVSIGTELKQQIETKLAANDPPAPQAAPVEAPVEAPAPKVDDYERRMQKVLSQAQRVQAEKQAFAAEQARFKADMDELAQYRELKARAKDDPVSVAETFGYKPDEYATLLMEKGSLTPERRKILEQQKELQDLKSWRQQQEQQQQQAQVQQLYNSVQHEMASFVAEHAEQYDLVHRTRSYDRVLKEVQTQYQHAIALGEEIQDPWEFMPSALQKVEKELEDFYAPVVESPKFRSKLAPQAAEPRAPGAPLAQPAVRKPLGTINSKMRAESVPPKELSEAERLQKAGEALLNQMYGRR